MKQTGLLLIIILFFSCFEKRENIIQIDTAKDKLYIGMSKEELIKTIGFPEDSIIDTYTNENKYYFMYFTNDFSDYRLYVFFDADDKISSYRIN